MPKDSVLRLSDPEYAALILTCQPPRWLMPELYEAAGENPSVRTRQIVASANGHVIQITFDELGFSRYTKGQLQALEQVINGLSNLIASWKTT